MDIAAQIDAIVELAGKLEIEVRREHLGGEGGGFCIIRGRRVLFLDEDADPGGMLDRCVDGLASLPGIDQIFVPAEIRERLEEKMG